VGTLTVSFKDSAGNPVTVDDAGIDAVSNDTPPKRNRARVTSASTSSIDLPVGTYTVRIGVPGRGQFALTNVVVTAGATVNKDVTFTVATSTISGTVKDDAGATVANAKVTVKGVTDAGFVGGTTSAADGTFSVTVPAGASYQLGAFSAGYVPGQMSDIGSVPSVGNNLVLTRAASALSISGTVAGASEGAVITVVAKTATGQSVSTVLTGAGATAVAFSLPVKGSGAGVEWTVTPFADGFTWPAQKVTAFASPITGIAFASPTATAVQEPQQQQGTQNSVFNVNDTKSKVGVLLPAGSLGSGSGNVTVTTQRTSGAPETGNFSPLGGKAVEINFKTEDGQGINTLQSGATITLDYSDVGAALTQAERAALKAVYWDETASEWVVISGCTNDTTAMTFTCTGVTHFTKFSTASLASTTVASTPAGGSSGAGPAPTVCPVGTAQALATVSPLQGGSVTLCDNSVTVVVPSSSLTEVSGNVTVDLQRYLTSGTMAVPGQTVPVPGGAVLGSVGFGLQLRTNTGVAVNPATPITLRVRFTDSDVAKAASLGGTLRVAAYDAANKTWQVLPSEMQNFTSSVVAVTTRTGLFALVVELPALVLTGPDVSTVSSDYAPLLTWNLPPGTTQYQLQVIPANNDGPGINLIRSAESSYQVAAPKLGVGNYVLLPGMGYTWRVRVSSAATSLGESDSGWGPWVTRSFTTAPASAGSIGPVWPAIGSVTNGLTPTLQWRDQNSKVFYYEVQVSRDPLFGSDAFLYWELRHGGVSTPENSYTIPSAYPLESGTTYYWRVRPRVQGDGAPVPWSDAWSFVTP